MGNQTQIEYRGFIGKSMEIWFIESLSIFRTDPGACLEPVFFRVKRPEFSTDPTKSWKGSWRKFLVLPDPKFSRRKRPFCTTCILGQIEYSHYKTFIRIVWGGGKYIYIYIYISFCNGVTYGRTYHIIYPLQDLCTYFLRVGRSRSFCNAVIWREKI